MISIPCGLVAFDEYNLDIISLAFNPAFSAKVLGIHSKALPNLVKEYCSRPLRACPSLSSLDDN
jgi:hypothetical protein